MRRKIGLFAYQKQKKTGQSASRIGRREMSGLVIGTNVGTFGVVPALPGLAGTVSGESSLPY